MTGVEYYMRKQRRNTAFMRKHTGLTDATIRKLREDNRFQLSMSHYVKAADALNVPIRSLIQSYDPALLDPGDHATDARRKQDRPVNCIGVYADKHNLTYAELGNQLGFSRQYAHQLCQMDPPVEPIVERLARMEHMTPAAFRALYRPNRGDPPC